MAGFAAHLVTGRGTTNHIDSGNMAALYAGIVGSGNCVFEYGGNFEAVVQDANTIHVATGCGLIQGHQFMVEGSGGNVTIDNGTQGQNRNDIIVARYVKDDDGYENCVIDVVKGTPSDGAATDPEILEGNILTDNAAVTEFALYHVALTGINVSVITPLFDEVVSLESMQDGGINGDMITLGSIGMRHFDSDTRDSIFQGKLLSSNTITLAPGTTETINCTDPYSHLLFTGYCDDGLGRRFVHLVRIGQVTLGMAQSTSIVKVNYSNGVVTLQAPSTNTNNIVFKDIWSVKTPI